MAKNAISVTFLALLLTTASAEPLQVATTPSCERILGVNAERFGSFIATQLVVGEGTVNVMTLEDVIEGPGFSEFLRERAKAYLSRPVHSENLFIMLPSTAQSVLEKMACAIIDPQVIQLTGDKTRFIVSSGDPAEASHHVVMSPMSFANSGLPYSLTNISSVLAHELFHLQDIDDLQIYVRKEFGDRQVTFPVALFKVLTELRAYKKQARLQPERSSEFARGGLRDISSHLNSLTPDELAHVFSLFGFPGEINLENFEKYLSTPGSPPEFPTLLQAFRYRFE